ncbi:MAG TPA: EamA family transporter [Candidatus Limnocylindrales bacterium]|nr:EamA family transporter [Candidatus Limnocylindrales bacterium]
MAFALIYVVWGSTYLAMRFAIEAIPPFLMIGIRFLIAGSILYNWARFQSASKPTRKHWGNATIIGILLPAFGTGGVAWAEQFVPTGSCKGVRPYAPTFIHHAHVDDFDRCLPTGGTRPNLRVLIGLIAGFIGVALLIGPGILTEEGKNIDPMGAVVLIAAAISWAEGSIFSRHAILQPVPFQTAGMEMLVGGILMTTLGLLLGEGSRIHLTTLSARSLLSLLYLIVFGSLITYVAYIWLLKKTSVAAVPTYA